MKTVKKCLKFINATIFFYVIMLVAISIYAFVMGLEKPYEEPFLFWLNFFAVDCLSSILVIVFGWMTMTVVFDYIQKYESPKDAIKMFRSQADISWTEVEYDDEGDEIKRQKHNITIFHNASRTDDDKNLDRIVQFWHNYRRANNLKEKSSAEDLCEFINLHTMYKAATTQEEFDNLLRGTK